ncbi:hypothetical protein HWV62_19829 [Athelia sp. TMB]|nr:hypothetical protein HWV62_19829 [Athelia sp. TMB]
MTDSFSTSFDPSTSFRGKYAQIILADHQKRLLQQMKNDGRMLPGLPPPYQRSQERSEGEAPVTVGIIGAGAAGLYASLIIDSLEDARVTYEIFDANPMKDRKGGGRLFTYKFPKGGENDYYDVGAMRFPDIPFMKPLFDLIRDNPDSPIAGVLDSQIIPYNLSKDEDISFFNGVIKTSKELNVKPPPLDPFDTNVGAKDTVSNMVSAAIGGLREPFEKETTTFEEAWNNLMQYDQHSTRTYIALVNPKYSDEIVNYMETFNTATNLFDQALSETVMDDLTFDWGENVPWKCIQGGAGKIADAMRSNMKKTVEYGKRVTSITPVVTAGSQDPTSVHVKIANEQEPRNYDHVISTMPFSCLRMVDTTNCGFDWNFQTAIRALHYDSSVKVAIRFSDRWWEDTSFVKEAHRGGVSSTDRPTRTVVYPSYGIDGTSGATMIASYTWAQDAMRLGSLMDTPSESLILERVIQDLADMHQVNPTILGKKVLDYNVHDWYADDASMGAFALFGPGQFRSLYPAVTQPVGGLLHFAGEATSVHHATVYEILYHEGFNDLIDVMQKKWPQPEEFNPVVTHTQIGIGQRMLRKIQRFASALSSLGVTWRNSSCHRDWTVFKSRPPGDKGKVAGLRALKIINFAVAVHLFVEYVGSVRGRSTAKMAGPSMEPTLANSGEWVVENRLSYNLFPNSIARGDLVTLRSPLDPYRIVCKRVLGLAGDVICVDPTGRLAPSTEHVIVPKGHVWISGDNAAMSRDSRMYGPVSVGLITGKLSARVWPPSKFTIFHDPTTYID